MKLKYSQLGKLIIVQFLFLLLFSCQQKEIWIKKADMPTARLGLTMAVVDNRIYAIGGYAKTNAEGLSTTEEYYPRKNEWKTRASMPTNRRWMASSVVYGKIHMIGGATTGISKGHPGLKTVEEFIPNK